MGLLFPESRVPPHQPNPLRNPDSIHLIFKMFSILIYLPVSFQQYQNLLNSLNIWKVEKVQKLMLSTKNSILISKLIFLKKILFDRFPFFSHCVLPKLIVSWNHAVI